MKSKKINFKIFLSKQNKKIGLKNGGWNCKKKINFKKHPE
jgi:hypothetical protein